MINILVSFAYIQKSSPDRWRVTFEKLKQAGCKLILDSGAYTAWKSGTPIDLNYYIDYVHRNGELFNTVAALDVILDRKGTERNLQIMLDAGLKPMPVLTEDMTLDEVPKLREVSERIAVPIRRDVRREASGAWIEQVYRAAGGDVLIHGFSYTKGPVWRSKVATVDSTTWCNGGRFGHFGTFGLEEGCLQQPMYRVKKWLNGPLSLAHPELVEYMRNSRISREDFLNPVLRRGSYSICGMACIEAWVKFAEACEARGVEFYFALGTPADLSFLATSCAFSHPTERGLVPSWVEASTAGHALSILCKKNYHEWLDWVVQAFHHRKKAVAV